MAEDQIFILVMLAAVVYVFVVRVLIAYLMARHRYRDPLGWVLLSFFFSPVLTWIILLIVGDDNNARERAEHLTQYEKDNEWHRHDEETRYSNSSYEDNTH